MISDAGGPLNFNCRHPAFLIVVHQQRNPDHVLDLLRWAQRFIFNGHIVTPGFCQIGPVYSRDKSTGQYKIVKEKGKIGTHSGYMKYKFNMGQRYYGWQPEDLLDNEPYTINKFLKYAIWLMSCPSYIMRDYNFEFNCLHFHTNSSTILDIDDYKGKINEGLLQLIINMIPPDVPCVKSQNGGRHYYFRKTINVSGKPKIGIDLIQNGFVFCPPSAVRDGGSYSFSNIKTPGEFPEKLPEMPPTLQMYLAPSNVQKPAKQICKPYNGSITSKQTSKPYSGPITGKQIDIVNKLASEADGADDRSHYDYVCIKWCQKIGMSADDAWEQVKLHGKFIDRGREYFDRTWENSLNSR